MALGSMSYPQALDAAKRLGDIADNMDNQISQLRAEMESLESVLKSKGATELYLAYKGLDAKIDGFPNKVRAFKGFLESAVAQYEADDASLMKEV